MAKPTYLRDLVYGISGAGKTSWWLRLAIYLYETKGLRSRWLLGDGGGQTITVSGAEEFVDIMPYSLWDNPLETTAKICEGWWPQDPTVPNSKLIPTTMDQWAGIGLATFEGMSVMADYMMGDKEGGLANRMAKNQSLNNDESFRLKDGDRIFGGNARTHYGFVQRRIRECIEATRALPCHVGWTAHERKAEDDDTREVWMGPDVAGKALTTKIGASFGNTIHLHPIRVKTKSRDRATGKEVESFSIERRAYTRIHSDPEAIHFVKYYANTRLPQALVLAEPDFLPEWIAPDPLAYYARLEEARAKSATLVKTQLASTGALTL